MLWRAEQRGREALDSGQGLDPQLALSSLRRARRVLVLGCSGAGKTHLAVRLSGILDLPLVHLDAHFWKPGWVPSGEREWRAAVTRLAACDSWLMDGTYERSLDLRVPRADAVVLVESPRIRCLGRVLKRAIEALFRPRSDVAAGCTEPIAASHVRYVWRYPAVTRRMIQESLERYGRGKCVAVIDGPDAVEPFLAALA